MDVTARRSETGEYLLEMGYVSIELPAEAVATLSDMIHKRLNQSSSVEQQLLEKKIKAYRALANKMTHVDDRIIQQIAVEMTPEQLVTMTKLAEGERLFHKVVRNLSRQNARQFQEDFKAMDKITEHQASVNMEKIVPLIKAAAQKQKMQG